MRSKKNKLHKRKSRSQKGGNYFKDITLGILSWKSCKTLVQTLESYKKSNLLNLVEPLIYFQEISDVEKKLAEKYSTPFIGSDKNVGIQKALIELINSTKTKYFIFAENDFQLIHNEETVKKVLYDCINLIDKHDIKIVKLRDIQNPGEPLYSKYIYINDFKDKPNQQNFRYKLEALSYVDNPEESFPNIFEIINLNYKWYKCSNKDNVWSNNVFIASTQWLKESVLPLLDYSMDNTQNKQMFEDVLINKLDSYNLAAGQGLFTHNRVEHGECLLEHIQNGGKKKWSTRKNKINRRKTRLAKQKGGQQKPKIHCITVSTKDNEKLQRLLKSAKKYNINIEVLGLDMNTDTLGHSDNQKFGMKLRYPLEYLNKLDDNDLLLFSDAWDVIYIDNLDSIYEKYKKFNKPIVFGAELFAWPDADKASEYTDTQNEYFKYLNSGLYIGVAKDLKEILNNYKGGEDIDDQRFWVDMYFKNRDKIALDVKAELFLDAAGTDKNDYDFTSGSFIFKKTGTSPSVIHANSSNKTYLDLFNSMIGGENAAASEMIEGTKYCLVQYDNREISENHKKFKERNKEYCKKHGYAYMFFNHKDQTVPVYWMKVKLVNEVVNTNKYEGVLWIDTDAVIKDLDRTLDSFGNSNTSIVICEDFHPEVNNGKTYPGTYPFNAGVWIAKNNDIGKDIMNKWLELYNPDHWKSNNKGNLKSNTQFSGPAYEQGSFVDIILPKYKDNILVLPWYVFNALDAKRNSETFILHFCSNKVDMEEIFLKYLDEQKGGGLKEITWFLPAYVPFVNAGAELMAHAINKYLLLKGFVINVVGPWEPQAYDKINYISNSNQEEVDKAIERSRVLFAQQNSSEHAVDLGSKNNKMVIIVVHNTERQFYDLEKFKTKIDPNKLFIVFNSSWVKEDYKSDLQSMVLHPPVNCKEYYTETNHKYVTLINVSELKGGNQLIEIAKRMPDIEFLGVEGGYDTQIRDDTVKNIKYVPNTQTIKDVYAETDILIMPSSAETWGRTATEALCSGIPVLANPTPGLKENLGDAGVFIDRNSIDEWVGTIRKLKDDRNYYNEVSEKCKQRSKELDSEPEFNTLLNRLNTYNGGNYKDLSGNSKEHLEIILDWINNNKKFGLIRPGDGEYNIMINNDIKVMNNWEFKKDGKLKDDLINSLKKNLPNLYVGISCNCCIKGKEIQEFYKNMIQLPDSRKTYANIFVNANYKRFIKFMKSYSKNIYYVGPGKKESNEIKIKERFYIDKFLVNNWDSQNEIVTNQLLNWVKNINDSLIVFSAGPITKVWIPLLLEKYPNNIYLDVGSSLNLYLDETPEFIRPYQKSNSTEDAQKICNFNV